MFLSNKLAENLKSYRKAKNLSQADLAELLKISAQSISKWECGNSTPDVEKLCRLSEIFNVSIDTLVGHSAEKKKMMIAVDGGGTKTEFILFSEDGVIIEHMKLGACNPNAVGMDKSVEILTSGIDAFLNTCPSVCGIYIGSAGFLLGNKSATIANILAKRYPHIKIRCGTDILNVIASSEINEDCIAVISGTGVSVLVKNGEDLLPMAGWGYLIGKWGSGFDIGRDAIYSALADTEKLGRHTKITEILLAQSEKSIYDLLGEVYKQEPSYIASFAPIVFEAYRMGDEVAADILNENAKQLAYVINRSHKVYGKGNKVVLSGSLLTTNDIFRTLIDSHLDSGLQTVTPSYPQIYGACVICAQMCNVDTTELHNNFVKQYRK